MDKLKNEISNFFSQVERSIRRNTSDANGTRDRITHYSQSRRGFRNPLSLHSNATEHLSEAFCHKISLNETISPEDEEDPFLSITIDSPEEIQFKNLPSKSILKKQDQIRRKPSEEHSVHWLPEVTVVALTMDNQVKKSVQCLRGQETILEMPVIPILLVNKAVLEISEGDEIPSFVKVEYTYVKSMSQSYCYEMTFYLISSETIVVLDQVMRILDEIKATFERVSAGIVTSNPEKFYMRAYLPVIQGTSRELVYINFSNIKGITEKNTPKESMNALSNGVTFFVKLLESVNFLKCLHPSLFDYCSYAYISYSKVVQLRSLLDVAENYLLDSEKFGNKSLAELRQLSQLTELNGDDKRVTFSLKLHPFMRDVRGAICISSINDYRMILAFSTSSTDIKSTIASLDSILKAFLCKYQKRESIDWKLHPITLLEDPMELRDTDRTIVTSLGFKKDEESVLCEGALEGSLSSKKSSEQKLYREKVSLEMSDFLEKYLKLSYIVFRFRSPEEFGQFKKENVVAEYSLQLKRIIFGQQDVINNDCLVRITGFQKGVEINYIHLLQLRKCLSRNQHRILAYGYLALSK